MPINQEHKSSSYIEIRESVKNTTRHRIIILARLNITASPSIYLKKILLGSFSATYNICYLFFLYISLSTVNNINNLEKQNYKNEMTGTDRMNEIYVRGKLYCVYWSKLNSNHGTNWFSGSIEILILPEEY